MNDSSEQAQHDAVHRALVAVGITAEIRAVPSDQLALAAKTAAGESVDVIIAGGGDGTISTVAAALAGGPIPLGVLPLGTLNHFAKDLGVPLDLAGAAALIATGQAQAVDLGRVNDRIFINNSSLGLYPQVVLEREAHRDRHGWGKWTALAVAVFKVFRLFPMLRVRLATPHGSTARRTPLVFVGNNQYQTDLPRMGTRTCLTAGELCLHVAHTQSRWGMLVLSLRALVGRLRQARDLESVTLTECWIETRRRRLHVALDGEVITLAPPLHYRIWPGALRVYRPQRQPTAGEASDEKMKAEG